MKRFLLILVFFFLPLSDALGWSPARENESWLGNGSTPIIGHNRDYVVGAGETLMEIAVRAGVGFSNLQRANPNTDPWHPRVGSRLVLPKAFLPPAGIGDGITINLAEMRLFLVWSEQGKRKIRSYALGVGREGWNTPLGEFQVTQTVSKPSWTPSLSLRTEKPGLPGVIPAGPDNPLGEFWIGTSATGIGLHGTNQPYGVGRRVSHGCLRLFPRDIRDLVSRVYSGMPVRIIDQPTKFTVRAGALYLESHSNPADHNQQNWPEGPWPIDQIRQAILTADGLPKLFPATN